MEKIIPKKSGSLLHITSKQSGQKDVRALSLEQKGISREVSPLGHGCLCAKAMPRPKREVIYINPFLTGVTKLSTEDTKSLVLEML